MKPREPWQAPRLPTGLPARIVLAAAAAAAAALAAAPAAAWTQAAAGAGTVSVTAIICPPPSVSDPGNGGC